MKRIIYILLSVCVVMAVAACGGSNNEPEGNPAEEKNPFEQYADGDIVTDLTSREWVVDRNNPEYFLTSDGTIISVTNQPDESSVYCIGVITKAEEPEEPETPTEPETLKEPAADRPAEGEVVYDDDGTPWVVSENGEFCFVNGFVCTDPTDEEGNVIDGWFAVDRYIDDSGSDGETADDPYDLGDPDLYGANAKADSFYEWDNPTIVTDVDGNQWVVVSVDWDYYMTPDGYVISDPTDDDGNPRDDLLTVCAWE